jgi:hypothetical protein
MNDVSIVFGVLIDPHGPWVWKLCEECGDCKECSHFWFCRDFRPIAGDRGHVKIGSVLDSMV